MGQTSVQTVMIHSGHHYLLTCIQTQIHSLSPRFTLLLCSSFLFLLAHSRTSLELFSHLLLHYNLFWIIPSAGKRARISLLSPVQALPHFLSSHPTFIPYSKRELPTWVFLPYPLVPTPNGLPPPTCPPLWSPMTSMLVNPMLYSQNFPAAADMCTTPSSWKHFLPGLYGRSSIPGFPLILSRFLFLLISHTS